MNLLAQFNFISVQIVHRLDITISRSCVGIIALFLLSYLGVAQTPLSENEKYISNLLLDARDLHLIHRDSAMQLVDQAVAFTQANEMDSLLVRSLDMRSRILQIEGEFEEAFEPVREARAIVRGSGKNYFESRYFYRTASLFNSLNQNDSSIYYYHLYDELLVRQNKPASRWSPHYYLALLYNNMGDREKGIYHLEESLKYIRISKNPTNYGFVLLSSIERYTRWGMIEESENLTNEYFEYKTSQSSGSGTSKKSNKQLDLIHSSVVTPLDQSLSRAEVMSQYLDKELKAKNWILASNTAYALGNLYLKNEAPLKAIDAFEKAIVASDSFGLPDSKLNAHLGAFLGYKAIKRMDLANEYLLGAYHLREEIRDKERQTLIEDMNVKYETAKKEKELTKTALQLNKAEQRQWFMGIGIATLIGLLGLSIWIVRVRQKNNRILEEKNATITKALEDKKILLKEIHHRVKNNLQMVSSLLYLQGKSIDDPKAKGAIQESENRVQSMAMLHQNLYQDDNLLGVDVVKYFERLINHLLASYNIDKNRLTIHTDIRIKELDVDTVIPMALVINELVSNSLKHGFRDARKGEVHLAVREKNTEIEVEVKDNGVGMKEGVDMQSGGNFGFKLIRILTQQMKATLVVNKDQGTHFSLRIPKAA